MVFEASSGGPSGEAPVHEVRKAVEWKLNTLFPQRSRNSPATQLAGGAHLASHGAIYHDTDSAIEWHMAALH